MCAPITTHARLLRSRAPARITPTMLAVFVRTGSSATVSFARVRALCERRGRPCA